MNTFRGTLDSLDEEIEAWTDHNERRALWLYALVRAFRTSRRSSPPNTSVCTSETVPSSQPQHPTPPPPPPPPLTHPSITVASPTGGLGDDDLTITIIPLNYTYTLTQVKATLTKWEVRIEGKRRDRSKAAFELAGLKGTLSEHRARERNIVRTVREQEGILEVIAAWKEEVECRKAGVAGRLTGEKSVR